MGSREVEAARWVLCRSSLAGRVFRIVADLMQTPGLSLEGIVGDAGGSRVEIGVPGERLFDLMDAPGRYGIVSVRSLRGAGAGTHFDMALRMAASREWPRLF